MGKAVIIERWHVKYILSTCGLIGLCLGAILGIALDSSPSIILGGLIGFILSLKLARHNLGPPASHVVLKQIVICVAFSWVTLSVILKLHRYSLPLLLQDETSMRILMFVALWLTGFFAVFVEEPGRFLWLKRAMGIHPGRDRDERDS